MVVQWLQPAWLWGLLGLLVPLAIHLLHKRSRRVLLVGSLQAFRGGTPVQAQSLKLNEIWMLLLRCLLLGLFVLQLAQPVLLQNNSIRKRYVFVAPALASQSLTDSLAVAGYEARLLQPGLEPVAEAAIVDTTLYNYWDVFREIDALSEAGDTVWLLFHPYLKHFSGKRPKLYKTYVALPVKQAAKQKALIHALRLPKEQVLLQWWAQQGREWQVQTGTFTLEQASEALMELDTAAAIVVPDTLQVVLHVQKEADAEYWIKALSVLDSLLPSRKFAVQRLSSSENRPPAAGTDVWAWLSTTAPPKAFWERNKLLRFYYNETAAERWFIDSVAGASLYQVQHTFDEIKNNRQLMAAFLPELLQTLPKPAIPEAPPLLVPEDQWQGQKLAAHGSVEKQQSGLLESWLWAFLLVTFIVERWLSLKK